MKHYEAADLAPDTYMGEYFQPSVKVYKKDDADEVIANLVGALEKLALLGNGIAAEALKRYRQQISAI